jgi:hypothetical protein
MDVNEHKRLSNITLQHENRRRIHKLKKGVSDPNLLYLTNEIVELKWNTLYHRIRTPMTKCMLRSQGIPSFCLILFQEHLRPRVRIMHRSLVTCICELFLRWGRTIKKISVNLLISYKSCHIIIWSTCTLFSKCLFFYIWC